MDALKYIVEDVLKALEARKASPEFNSKLGALLESRREVLPLVKSPEGNSIIAEVKFASPSEGDISGERLEDVVSEYVNGGASALSILTEQDHFKGSLKFIERARKIAQIPILRKDFIVDEFQLKEARAYGADGVLLIAQLLDDRLAEFIKNASSLGLWSLVETRNLEEVEKALSAGADAIGINNRDLKTLKVDLNTTIRLSERIPKNKILVAESGINKPADIQKLKNECQRKPDFYLIGTSLMKARDRMTSLKALEEA
jgi:indole-3-glycerol phosphate synthase